jgi:hypothetical protein
MEDRALQSSSTSTTSTSTQLSAAKPSCRNVWVLTAYGISGLGLFGVLAYYFVQYVTK